LSCIAQPVGVAHISTYVPRKCGIATFTKDLINATNFLTPTKPAKVIALINAASRDISYPEEVIFKIEQEEREDYKKAAQQLNKRKDIEAVVIQHEYGIYGGKDGELVLTLLDYLQKPVLVVFHTVLLSPTKHQRDIITSLGKKAALCITMLSATSKILTENYKIPQEKIAVIHHGIPDYPRRDTLYWKKKLGLENHTVMTSINLLSPQKGIEYAIMAIPEIKKYIPNIIYLVVGETHPMELFNNKGKDTYREKLTSLVKSLHIEKHVKFINRYLPLEELVEYVAASDFYITPYLNPQQAASGALAYALGNGKLCISTPYFYAKEMLSKNRGILVPFKKSSAIAKSVIGIWHNPEKFKILKENAYRVGRTMTWNYVGHLYFHLYQQLAKNGKQK
jgi:glycosyltransferase involved in cell wall biosynthesis